RRLREALPRQQGGRPTHLDEVPRAHLRLPQADPVGRGLLDQRPGRPGLRDLGLSDHPPVGPHGAADLPALISVTGQRMPASLVVADMPRSKPARRAVGTTFSLPAPSPATLSVSGAEV